jgi:hypothetical protein
MVWLVEPIRETLQDSQIEDRATNAPYWHELFHVQFALSITELASHRRRAFVRHSRTPP